MRVCAFLFGIVSQEAAGALFLRVLDELPGRALLHHHAAVHEQDAVGHILFMDGGVVVEEGPAKQLIDHPREQRTKQFLAHYAE